MFKPEPIPKEILDKFEAVKDAEFWHLKKARANSSSIPILGEWLLYRIQYQRKWYITQVVQVEDKVIKTSSGIDFEAKKYSQDYASTDYVTGNQYAILYDLDKTIALYRQHLEAEAAADQARDRHDAEYFGRNKK